MLIGTVSAPGKRGAAASTLKMLWGMQEVRLFPRGELEERGGGRGEWGEEGDHLKNAMTNSCHFFLMYVVVHSLPRSIVVGSNRDSAGAQLAIPSSRTTTTTAIPQMRKSSLTTLSETRRDSFPDSPARTSPDSSTAPSAKNVSGVLFALKHWICKHFFVSGKLTFFHVLVSLIAKSGVLVYDVRKCLIHLSDSKLCFYLSSIFVRILPSQRSWRIW